MEQYYKIGLVFCRNNITLKSPRSLKELSATKVSENMLKVEKSEQQVSSLCSGSGCKHAAKQCKHYRKQSSSSSQSSSGGIASPWSAKTKRRSGCVVKTEQVEHVSRDSGGKNRDNGLKSKDIGECKIIHTYSCGFLSDHFPLKNVKWVWEMVSIAKIHFFWNFWPRQELNFYSIVICTKNT